MTFCWFKVWRSRQDDRRPEAFRGMSAVFPRRARTYPCIIHTYLVFVKNKMRLHRVALRGVAATCNFAVRDEFTAPGGI